MGNIGDTGDTGDTSSSIPRDVCVCECLRESVA